MFIIFLEIVSLFTIPNLVEIISPSPYSLDEFYFSDKNQLDDKFIHCIILAGTSGTRITLTYLIRVFDTTWGSKFWALNSYSLADFSFFHAYEDLKAIKTIEI